MKNKEEDAVETILDFGGDPTKRCIDGGKCHHNCNGDCFREKFCAPLSGSGLDDNWQPLQ